MSQPSLQLSAPFVFADALLWSVGKCWDCGQLKPLYEGSPRKPYCRECVERERAMWRAGDRAYYDDPQFDELEIEADSVVLEF